MVKAEQGIDRYCNSLEIGKFKGKSVYIYDKGVIQEKNEWKTPVDGPDDVCKRSEF
jgi:hypothetical protein